MARRRLLSEAAWAARLACATDEREVVRHYTLNDDDLDVIVRKRLDANRLGFAVALCLMRFPGWALERDETAPEPMLGYVARQLGAAGAIFDNGADRDKERRKHLAEIMRRFGYRPFDRSALKQMIGWLTPVAQMNRKAEPLIDAVIGELRQRQILLPPPRVLELIVHQARGRGERVAHMALIGTLTSAQRTALDALLSIKAETTLTHLGWLRTVSRSPAARNIVRLIERLRFVRELDLDRDLAKRCPPPCSSGWRTKGCE